MAKKESILNEAADALAENANSISRGRHGNDSVSEMSYCVDDEVIGAYPQAAPASPGGDFIDDGYLYFDRFPEPATVPIELELQEHAKWTDVLSASLRYFNLLANPKAMDVLEGHRLGNVRVYDAIVKKGNEEKPYKYIFVCNHVGLQDTDFARSECYIVDMLGDPLGQIDIGDGEDYRKKVQEANDGELPGSEAFSRIAIGKLQLLPGHVPDADLFGVGQFDTRRYITNTLRDALMSSKITGLEFSQNSRLHF